MAKVELKGMEAYLTELRKAGEATGPVCEAAVYAGAKVVADAIKQKIKELDRVSDDEALAAYKEQRPVKISVSQKIGLKESFGVTPIKNQYGMYSAKVGFDGYNSVKSKRWPKGQPNQLIARACESGSSAMIKQPFIRTTLKSVQQAAELAMEQEADKKLKEITGGE